MTNKGNRTYWKANYRDFSRFALLLPVLVLSPSILLVGFLTAIVVGFASGFLPGLGAMRMRVVNALRRV